MPMRAIAAHPAAAFAKASPPSHNRVIVMLDGLITFIDERGMEWDDKRLGRHLKLRDLNVLLTVARCGSMGKAAAELALSQPAVSKVIADMEFTLGVRLLDRGPQGGRADDLCSRPSSSRADRVRRAQTGGEVY
jgi:hypothetical protein